MKKNRISVSKAVLSGFLLFLVGNFGILSGCSSDNGESTNSTSSEQIQQSSSELIGSWTYHQGIDSSDPLWEDEQFQNYKYKNSDELQETYVFNDDGTFEYYWKSYYIDSYSEPPQLDYEYYKDGTFTADNECIHFKVKNSEAKIDKIGKEDDEQDPSFDSHGQTDFILYYTIHDDELQLEQDSSGGSADEVYYKKDK